MPNILEPVCFLCRRLTKWQEPSKCDAFSGGIPQIIRDGKETHTKPMLGDQGLTFQPYEREEEPEMEESVALALQNYRSGLIDADDLVAFLVPSRLEERGD